jgi:hypothetical protein
MKKPLNPKDPQHLGNLAECMQNSWDQSVRRTPKDLGQRAPMQPPQDSASQTTSRGEGGLPAETGMGRLTCRRVWTLHKLCDGRR